MKVSITGISMCVWVIITGLNYFGIKADEGSVTQFVEAIINVASFIGMIYGQFRRPEVKAFVLKHGK